MILLMTSRAQKKGEKVLYPHPSHALEHQKLALSKHFETRGLSSVGVL